MSGLTSRVCLVPLTSNAIAITLLQPLEGYQKGATSVGRSFESDFVMVFTLQSWRITRFQAFCDGTAISAAYAKAVAAL
jgi:hypothetical protein